MKHVHKYHPTQFGNLSKEVPKNSKYAAIRASRKNNYMNQPTRNATLKDNWKVSDENIKNGVADYGKSSIENKPNERDITQKRTHTTNLTTEIKKLIAPITDIFRKTRKQNTIGNKRPDGNMKANLPSKPTVLIFIFFAWINALVIFLLLPDVVIATKTSPFFPSALICLENISS